MYKLKKKLAGFAAVLSLSLFTVGLTHASGNVNLLIGQKSLKSEDWEPAEKQMQYGLLVDFGGKSWPVNIAIDILKSEDDETINDPILGTVKLTGETQEIDVGARKIWDISPEARPYIGGGLALIDAKSKVKFSGLPEVSISDDAVGYWLNAGIYGTLAGHFNIGLDLRYSAADVDFAGTKIEAGGTHIGLFFGYHWD